MKTFDPEFFRGKVTVVTGHYGCGKTNFSVNLAADLAKGSPVYLIDYDNVNPYFRAADAEDELKIYGAALLSSNFANTNVDIPALPQGINAAFRLQKNGGSVIFDVGGDMLGAISLGTLHGLISSSDPETVYVFNPYRPLTSSPQEAFEILKEIESASGLKVTALVNNANIGAETQPDDIAASYAYADELCRLSGLPLLCVCSEVGTIPCNAPVYLIKDHTKHIF